MTPTKNDQLWMSLGQHCQETYVETQSKDYNKEFLQR